MESTSAVPFGSVKRQPVDPGISGWDAILGGKHARPKLQGSHSADVVIIGGGFAGLSAARRAKQIEPNARVILLEARQIADGPAGRNTGFMIDLPHVLSSSDYAGVLERDRQQTSLNRAAIAFASEAVADYEVPEWAFQKVGKTNVAATLKGTRHNQHYAAHLTRMSEPHEMLDAQQMKEICGSSYYQCGLYTPGTVMIHPAQYVRTFANGVERDGVSLFEHSPVTRLQRQHDDWRIETPNGLVSAHKVILAVNGHLESFGFKRRQLMHVYLYASMTRPLSDAEIRSVGGDNDWGFTPADPMGSSLRKISGPDGHRLIIRNRFRWSPERDAGSDVPKSIATVHDRTFTKRFPQLAEVGMQYRWGGLLCLTRNDVPVFGELEHGLFSACCQNGLGTVHGTLAGKLAAELAFGLASEFANILLNEAKPHRLPPEPVASIGANAYLRWAEWKAGREL